ncbi:hypothetical protein WMF31_22820 [Sorangium sp. So ce1036]|uniref:hypothetical protein n=1 Tax=Sorangium sp. So ce1036 TaxID=3133328 RepID=UPI003F0B14FF
MATSFPIASNRASFATTFALPAATQPQLPPVLQNTLCAGDQPLVLLPVRLETRFFAQAGGASELRVRIYPDKIHIDAHDPELTPAELQWGQHHWEQDWRAGSDDARRAAAWRQLAERFGSARAAWIRRLLQPANARPMQPTAADQPLSTPPQFPTVAVAASGQDSAWRHAPQARLLPDRWIAVVQSDGKPVLAVEGKPITKPLAVGPDPQAAPLDPASPRAQGEQPAVDDGMRWMIDFDAAEAAGMALRIAVPASVMSAGIESLFVLGVATATDAAAGAEQIGRLLDAHHYTDGLGFVRQGTPSNNTAERRAGYRSDDPGAQDSYANEVARTAPAADADSNAMRLGRALGVPEAQRAVVLAGLDNAGLQHDLDARQMNTALWPATWGYFLTNMVGFAGTGLTPEHLAWAREHFVQHVRAGGPYAALRCGRQPYGVLPVTSLDLWQADATTAPELAARETWLRNFVIKLRDNVWRPRLSEVPRVGRRSPLDPDADLADVMRTEALSSGYSTRALLGRHYLQHLRAFFAEDLQASGFIGVQDALTIGVVQRLGFPWRPRLARGTYDDRAWRVKAPLVQPGEVSPWRKLEPDYIGTLLQLSIDQLAALQPAAGTSLLQALLRHALLLEVAMASAQINASAGGDLVALLTDVELIDLVTGAAPTLHLRRQLDAKVAGVTGDQTLRQYLESLIAKDRFDTPAVRTLGELRASFTHLRALDSENLQLLMQGTLDLASHRLDAWATSLATQRLSQMRSRSAPQGSYVGGYGWVENLRPAATTAPLATPPAGEPGPLFAAPNDSGFIHAPSMAHAATAALLRNAQLGAGGVPQADGPFAIDLSSRRVRDAEWLLDGVRQGQPLGALLGYRFERRLHELGYDRFISVFRNLAPLSAGKLQPATQPVEAIAANNVVDGLSLQQQWQQPARRAAILALPALASATAAERQALTLELDALNDSVDAMSDALTAEAVYQMVRGNPARTAAALQSLSSGDAPPPELEVTRTPRSGLALTHRVVALWSGEAAATTGWAAVSRSPRATAEPMLNAWAARQLGNPSETRCTVERLDDTGQTVLETQRFALSELGLTPLDVVYGVPAQDGQGRDADLAGSGASDLEQWLLDHARHRAGGFAAGARLRLQHGRPADLASGERCARDVIEQARALRRLLSSARAADADDLAPPERGDAGTLDIAELDARVTGAASALVSAHEALDTLVTRGAAARIDELRAAMFELARFGVPGAIPASVGATDAAELQAAVLAQATALLRAGRARVDADAALAAMPAVTDVRARRDRLFERARTVFGGDFVVLPRFSCAHAAELGSALAGSTAAQGGDALACHTWLARSARVRDGIARFADALNGAEVLSATAERLRLCVAQLPFQAQERWVGLAPADARPMPAGKLSLVVQLPSTALDPTAALAGLLIDEWVEVVPSRHETTALAFQFNPPDACAPQSVLLAVPPVPGQAWTAAQLHRVLVETLDLAKLRAIDVEALGEMAHYLPALFFAFNTENDVASTDFAALT